MSFFDRVSQLYKRSSIDFLIQRGLDINQVNDFFEGKITNDSDWEVITHIMMIFGDLKGELSPKRVQRLLPAIWRASQKDLNYLDVIGTGAQSLVLYQRPSRPDPFEHSRPAVEVYKIGSGIRSEMELLYQLVGHHGGLKNIVSPMLGGWHEEGEVDVIQLEKIWGYTLEEYLNGKDGLLPGSVLSLQEVIKLSGDIFHGLVELYALNIFHRDLWLGNVMLDYENKKALIIDLGQATDDSDNYPECNQRYGGENDLQSLGQIMYKMATGHHLFNPTIDKSTHWIPNEIKAERERTYSDPEQLERRLQQVEENVHSPQVAEIIRLCLTAEGSDEDYQTLEQRFNDATSHTAT